MKEKSFIDCGKDNYPEESNFFEELMLLLAKYNVNILEVSQSILQEMFCMIMVCDVEKLNVPFGEFGDAMSSLGRGINMAINVMHEDLFNSMHRI